MTNTHTELLAKQSRLFRRKQELMEQEYTPELEQIAKRLRRVTKELWQESELRPIPENVQKENKRYLKKLWELLK